MNKIFNILVVEDNTADFLLLEKALNRIEKVQLKIWHVTDGQQAVDFAMKQGKFENAVDIELIILDLNLPVLSGLQALKQLKEDDCTRVIPTIIYTTSEENVDVVASYSFYANSYVTKSFEIKEVFEKIRILGEYWLKTSKLPDNQWL